MQISTAMPSRISRFCSRPRSSPECLCERRPSTLPICIKITAEDWRNRKKWDAYERAVCDMVDRTSTSVAPWTLVEANNKYFARIKVLKTIVRALEEALDAAGKKGKKKKRKKQRT